MNLIIDIDDNDYELFKNSTIKPDWDTMWHGKEKDKEIMFATVGLIECLKNGIPCSSEGDLINRSALRDEVQRICKTYTEMSANQLGYDILRAIDNTPVVELERSQGEWTKGFHEGFNAGNRLAEAFSEDTPYKDAYNKTLEEMKKECRSMTKPMEYLYYGECLGTFEQTFNKHLRETENETDN